MGVDFQLFEPVHKAELLDMMAEFYEIDGYSFDREMTFSNIDLFSSDSQLGQLYLLRVNEATIGYLTLTFGFSFEYGGRGMPSLMSYSSSVNSEARALGVRS